MKPELRTPLHLAETGVKSLPSGYETHLDNAVLNNLFIKSSSKHSEGVPAALETLNSCINIKILHQDQLDGRRPTVKQLCSQSSVLKFKTHDNKNN